MEFYYADQDCESLWVNFKEDLEGALKFRDDLKDEGIYCFLEPGQEDWIVSIYCGDIVEVFVKNHGGRLNE